MRKILTIAIHDLYVNVASKKFAAAFILIFFGIMSSLEPVVQTAEVIGLNINCGIFSYLYTGNFVIVINFIAVLIIFSEVPKYYPSQNYILLREGKRKWILSQLIYILLMSLLITVIVGLSGYIISFRKIYVGDSWGKIITSIAYGEVSSPLYINPYVLIEFSPGEALVWTVSGFFVTTFMIGLINLIFNLFVYQFSGTVLTGIMLALHLMVSYMDDIRMSWFSPIDWCRLGVMDSSGNGNTPNAAYINIVRILIIAVCIILAIAITGKKRDILKYVERSH